MAWFRLDALNVDRSHLTIEVFLVPEYAADADLAKSVLDEFAGINGEDVLINLRTAEGLRSKYAEPGRISHLEAGTWHFRQWLLASMGG